jgi:hypothetical protein
MLINIDCLCILAALNTYPMSNQKELSADEKKALKKKMLKELVKMIIGAAIVYFCYLLLNHKL